MSGKRKVAAVAAAAAAAAAAKTSPTRRSTRAGAEQRAAYEAAVVAHEEEEVRTVRSTVPRGEYQRRGAQHVHAFFYPVQTLGETPPGAHQFVRIEYQRRGNPHGFRPGVPSTIE